MVDKFGPSFYQGLHTKNGLDLLLAHGHGPVGLVRPYLLFLSSSDGFKLLASNYLNIEGDHQLYREIEGLLNNVEVTPAEIAKELLKSGGTDVVLGGLVKFLEKKILQKAKAAELKKLLKSDHDTDIDVKGFVKFLEKEKLKKAKAEEAEQLLKSNHTDVDVDVDVEGLVKLFKQKKLEDAKAADAKCINPNELMGNFKRDGSCSQGISNVPMPF